MEFTAQSISEVKEKMEALKVLGLEFSIEVSGSFTRDSKAVCLENKNTHNWMLSNGYASESEYSDSVSSYFETVINIGNTWITTESGEKIRFPENFIEKSYNYKPVVTFQVS